MRFFKHKWNLIIKLEIKMADLTQSEADALAAQIVANTANALAIIAAKTSVDDTALKAAVDAQTTALSSAVTVD